MQGVSNYVTTQRRRAHLHGTGDRDAGREPAHAGHRPLHRRRTPRSCSAVPPGALIPLVLNDNNLPPAGVERARMRFVNVSPGSRTDRRLHQFQSNDSPALADNTGLDLYQRDSRFDGWNRVTSSTSTSANTTTPVLKLPGVVLDRRPHLHDLRRRAIRRLLRRASSRRTTEQTLP